MKYVRLLMLAALVTLGGCAKELSADKANYVGLWKSNETSLLITASGRLEYESNAGMVKKSISAPITKFTDEKITAGFLVFNTDFVITRPPKLENGVWSMVIDAKELFKTDEQGNIPQVKIVPKLDKIRTLVTADLNRLAKGIKTNNFSEFIEQASLAFQSQFNNERMQGVYQPFVEKNVDLTQFMVGDFALVAEPSISPQGILTIRGQYPTSPRSLKFEALYFYVHPEWKSAGAELRITKNAE